MLSTNLVLHVDSVNPSLNKNKQTLIFGGPSGGRKSDLYIFQADQMIKLWVDVPSAKYQRIKHDIAFLPFHDHWAHVHYGHLGLRNRSHPAACGRGGHHGGANGLRDAHTDRGSVLAHARAGYAN